MTSDFRLPPVSSPANTGPTSRPADTAAITLQLLRPIDARLLPAGETVKAEVLSSTAQAGQFALMLRVAREGSSIPAEIMVTSRQPVPEGSQLLVQAINQTRLTAVIQSASSTAAAPGTPITRLDPAQFPPDSLMQARVLTQQMISVEGEQARYALLARILQGAGAGATLSITSAHPVEPGSLLNARVGPQGEMRMATPVEQQRQLDVSLALRDSLQRQGSAEPLMAALDKLARSESLPATLQPAVRQALMHLTNVTQLSTEAGVAQAVKQSGLFLENNLAMLANALKVSAGSAATAGSAETSPQTLVPSLTKLLPLLAGLATPPGAEPLPGADIKASMLNLLLHLQHHLPAESQRLLTFPPGPWQQALGIKPGAFPLPGRVLQALGETTDLGSLLRMTAALLSRIQHHQFQSLGQTQSFADGSTQTVWQLEIPLRDAQAFNHIQVRIQKDGQAPTAKTPEPVPQWEVRLAFNLDHLGTMQAIARLFKGKVTSEFWAERPGTVRLLDNELDRLRDQLLAKGLSVGDLQCRQGTPPEPRQAVQQRWVDEVT